ncbi:MAG TPA: diacylglycerol kinase family protein, partial [Chondromyces sp.]|nr:diacylglycerol kinase family protein [Chondromyces sp.]
IRLTEKEGDARRLAEEACQRKIDTVVSVGGDGTLNEIINGLAEKEYRPSLGVIPLGTVNDFARALGIPLKAEQAIHLIKEKVKKQVDIGKLNDHYFLNIVALGGIAEATAEVSTEMKTTLGSLAYLLEGMKSLRAKTPFSLEIETEGGRWKGEAFLFLAALTNSVGGFEKLAPEAEPDDGKLHCFIINELNLPQLFLIIPALLRGELKEHSKVQFFRTDKVRIHSLEPLKANMDGEEGDEVPLDIQVLPSHLEIFVPGEEDRDKTKLKGNGGM